MYFLAIPAHAAEGIHMLSQCKWWKTGETMLNSSRLPKQPFTKEMQTSRLEARKWKWREKGRLWPQMN